MVICLSDWILKFNKNMGANIIRVCVILFGLLLCSVKCVHFGLITPIEVVEEFGCHDTELRLTCGDLKSKLAILEASFTPNCTHDECLHFDLKRLVRAFTSEESDESKNAEKEAGQKFLETLRQKDSNGEELDVEILDDIELPDALNKRPKKHTSLRMVLERLIIRYLRRISPDDEIADEHELRSRRTVGQNAENPKSDDTAEYTDPSEEEEEIIRTQSARSHCDEQKKHISSLNRLDILKSYMNQSDNEYNIRKVLNKRCSGKNHCSFIFSIDHPFAKVWEGGVVRVKYICMEDYRINRYCAEHLTIGYEIDPNLQIVDLAKGDPKAEPRIQPRETSLHSLKIIKTSKSSTPNNVRNLNSSLSELRKSKSDGTVTPHINMSDTNKNRIYSQDFRVLKIIPSNVDDFNDLETIGDEIYFKKEEDVTTPQNNHYDHTPHTASYNTKTAIENKTENIILLGKDEKSNNDSDILENVTLTIREGAHYVMVYPNSNDTFGKDSAPNSMTAIEMKNKANIVITTQSTFSSSQTSNKDIFEFPVTPSDISILRATENYPIEEVDDENVRKQKDQLNNGKTRTAYEYKSIQRTTYRSPLLHGFAMTPGYPKFYIGEFDCHWNILAPDGIRIWITVLDNSLRFDEICKDYLLIEDVGTNQTLFNSCSDVIQPIEIKSSSNWIKVSIKTTSKFAYPKRGVLLYYTADGCVNQPLPNNVKLVGRTEDSAFYECHPSYLFPDSGLSTRKLTCSHTYVWDKLLPDCIEQESLSRGAVPSEEKLTLLSKKPDLSIHTNKMPSQNDADMVFDIIIPSILIAGLFVINGAVFAIIMKYRKRSKTLGEGGVELAEL